MGHEDLGFGLFPDWLLLGLYLYLGKTNVAVSPYGLGYDVVMKLVAGFAHQGYRLFIDNFYTGVALLKALVRLGIRACGTVRSNRSGFPCDFYPNNTTINHCCDLK